MWNISFCCRSTKVTKDGLAPIEMVITVDKKRSFKRLSMKVEPSEFNKLITCKRDNYIKRFCNSERLRVYDILSKLEMGGAIISIETIKDAIENGVNTNYTLSDLQQDFLHISKKRVGVDLSKPCYQRYIIVTNKVINILNNKGCRLISNKDMRLVAAELRRDLQPSSFVNQWSIIKMFINFGVSNNRIPGHNIFESIKVERKSKKVEYLTMEELDKIRNTSYSTPSLQRVADFAILEANLGMAYCDLVDIRRDDIMEHNGVKYIQKQRQKTGVEYVVIVNDEALEILERYDYNISITNQAYNRFLKIIALQAGINKPLHSHLLRHTFAHHQLNEKHLNIATVSKMLGHTNLKQTMHYCEKHTTTVLEEYLKANGNPNNTPTTQK